LVGIFKGLLPAFLLVLAGCSGGSIGLQEQVLPASYVYPLPACDSLVQKNEYSLRGVITRDGVTGDERYIFLADQSGRIFCLDAITLEERGMLHYKKSSILFKPLVYGDLICFVRFLVNENESVITFYDYRHSTEVASYTLEGIVLSQFQDPKGTISYLTSKGKYFSFSSTGQFIMERQAVDQEAVLANQSDSIAIFISPTGNLRSYHIHNGSTENYHSVKDASFIVVAGNRFLIVGRTGSVSAYQTGISSPIFEGRLSGRPSGLVLSSGEAWMVSYSGSVARYSFVDGGFQVFKQVPDFNPSGIASVHDSLIVVYGLQGGLLFLKRQNGGVQEVRYETGLPIDAIPSLREGRLIIGHRDGTIRSYGCE